MTSQRDTAASGGRNREPANAPAAEGLAVLLENLQQGAQQGELTFASSLEIMNSRGLPAVMLVPTLLMLMPFGLFPGSNALIGVVMTFVAGHIALGRQRVWLPKRLGRVRLSGRVVQAGLARLVPMARWLDRHSGRRLGWLVHGPLATRFAGLVMVILSLIAVLGGLVPGIPTIISAVVLLMAFGLLLQDGVILALGYGATGAAFWAIYSIWP